MATQPWSPLHPFLGRLTRRSVLSPTEEREILGLPTRLMQVAPNTDFVRLGETTMQAYVVLDGLVGRFDQNDCGGRQITALHIPGDMSDLQSVVQPRASSALQAMTTTTLAAVPHTALRNAAAAFPGIAEALWRDCSVDAAILAQWMVNIGRRDARTRLAHLICELACRFGAAPATGQVRFALPMTQAQLADATGLTPVHVNRVIKSLKSDGLTMRPRTVWIDNWKTFAKAGEFDEEYLQTGRGPAHRSK